MTLPAMAYRDQVEVLSRAEAGDVYRRERCLACAKHDPTKPEPCRLQLHPGRFWCRGFEEA